MTPAERRQLIDEVLDGEISEADFLRLEAELTVDPVARREYYDRVTLSLLLEAEASEASSVRQPSRDSSLRLSASHWGRHWTWAALSASLLIVAALWWSRSDQQPVATGFGDEQTPSGPARTEEVASGFAVVSGQADAVWGDGLSMTDGDLVPQGELHFRSGAAQFELFSGVTLVVEGESRFSIHSPMKVVLAQGKVRARVPELARGFRIATEAGEVVDLGTEFAVSVGENGSEVHVLDGEVEWFPKRFPTQRLEAGQAARLSNEGQVSLAAKSEDFVGALELRERLRARQASRIDRWREETRKLHEDPRLMAYYRVAAGDVSERRLRNPASGREEVASEGAIVAAGPASNRWGQAGHALDFSPAGSRVRLSVPGNHQSLTLLCWVKINSLDRWYNSLFLTDGHEVGEPHWQIMDDGRLFFSIKQPVGNNSDARKQHVFYSQPFWDLSLNGRWIMLATTYDAHAMQVTHYLNGEPISREAIPNERLVDSIKIGSASICNWSKPMYRTDPSFVVRNLNGCLDEFALYSAALSSDEVLALFRTGNPYEL